MKRILFISILLLNYSIINCQVDVFPGLENLGDFDYNNNPAGQFLIEVDPSVLPEQSALFTEVTSVMSGEWNDVNTWDCTCVPDLNNSVTIADVHAVTFMENKEVYTLHVTENASLTGVSGTTLKVNKDMALYGAAILSGVDIEMSGSGDQSILGNCTIDKLFCTESNTLNVMGNLYITDELWVGQSTFNTNGGLVLTTTEDGSAELAPIFDGNINGDITMTLDLAVASAGWVSLGSPLADGKCIEIVDDFVTTGFTGADFPTHSFVNVTYYEEPSDDVTTDYLGISSSDDLMVPGRGYYIYVLGGDYEFDASGSPSVGEVDINVTYTNNNASEEDGLNLISNPYPATINWDSQAGWEKENMVGAIYVWDIEQKQFRTYINGTGINGGSAFIKPMECFWVMASDANPSLTINEAAKSLHTSETESSDLDMTVTINDDTWSDQLVLKTNPDASFMFEPQNDALKFYGDNIVPNICTLSEDDVRLAINNIPELSESQDIEMMINIPTEGIYTISIDGISNNIGNRCLGLEDLVTGNVYDLAEVTQFEIFSPIVENEVRFVFRLGAPVTAEATSVACTGDENGQILTQGTGEGPWNYSWFDTDMNLLGEVLDEIAEFTISDLSAGEYIIQIENNDFCGSVTTDVDIFEPEEELTVLSIAYNIGCEEDFTGEILLNLSGGVQPFEVVWDNEMLGANIDNLGPGEYTYTVTDGLGCVREELIMITEASDIGEVGFMAEQVVILDENNEAQVNFINTSAGATEFEWSFGDGTAMVTEESPTHTYTQPGFFTVSMLAGNGDCDDYYQAVVVVEQYSGVAEQNFSDAVSISANNGRVLINSTSSNQASIEIEVLDLLGKRILSKNGNLGNGSTIQFDLNEANSIYVVSVRNTQTNERTVRKISSF